MICLVDYDGRFVLLSFGFWSYTVPRVNESGPEIGSFERIEPVS
jgi:hypothetical protein